MSPFIVQVTRVPAPAGFEAELALFDVVPKSGK
jgi:hypothetical protein